MKFDQAIYKNAVYWFILFFALAILAFWPSYYSRLGKETDITTHLHGIGMTLWTVLLISQAFLIRLKKYKLHKFFGLLSYPLVLFIIYSTVKLLQEKLYGISQINNSLTSFITLVLLSIFAFTLIYCLAIINKTKPLVHARYMICTIFPMITPLTDRLIYRFTPSLIHYAPTIDGQASVQFLGFILVDSILLVLLIIDILSNKRWTIFGTVLIINVLFQISVFTFYKFEIWQSFCLWFLT